MFVHPVACCSVSLGVVAQSLKLVRLLATANVGSCWPTMLCLFAAGFKLAENLDLSSLH